MAYAKSGNATEAYRNAGYKVRTDKAAGANAARLLGNDRVQARLAQICDEMAAEAIAQAKEIQEWFTKVMRGQQRDGGSEASLRDRLRAAELLAKMQGAFVDRKEVDMRGFAPVVFLDDVRE